MHCLVEIDCILATEMGINEIFPFSEGQARIFDLNLAAALGIALNADLVGKANRASHNDEWPLFEGDSNGGGRK